MTMMGKRLIIGQMNASRSPPVMQILGQVFYKRHLDILSIQEPLSPSCGGPFPKVPNLCGIGSQPINSHYGACFPCVECNRFGQRLGMGSRGQYSFRQIVAFLGLYLVSHKCWLGPTLLLGWNSLF